MKKTLLKNLSLILLFMVGLVLCIKELREPDMWWQLRAGEWMIENQQVTKTDMFSYTHEGVEWVNVKWLYEVLYAASSNVFGPEIIVLFQMISVVLILFFLIRIANHFLEETPFTNSSIILAGYLFLFIHAARINMRPEMTTYVLSLIYVYLFVQHRKKQNLWILVVIPLQLFWTNMHEAYGVGLVILLIFLMASFVEWALEKIENKHKKLPLPKLPLIAVFLSFLVVIINPHGTRMLTHLIEIYTQLGNNNFTLDLIGFGDARFWRPATITNMILFVLCTTYLLFFVGKGNWKARGNALIKKYGVVYLLLYIAFFYLSLKAVRNSFFFAMIAFPIYATLIQLAWNKLSRTAALSYGVSLGIGLVFYLSIVTNTFYAKLNPKESYGVLVDSENNPIGVSEFIKVNEIGGKGFTDYFSSSFMLWYLQPDFKTYLDLRDLDIFPQTFMKNVLRVYTQPDLLLTSGETLFEFIESFDDFNYIVLLNSDLFDPINTYIHQKDDYVLVYVDGLNSLYLKKNASNQALIQAYGNPENAFHYYANNTTPRWVDFMNKFFWPFYTQNRASNEKQEQIKAYYYQKFGV